MNSKFRMSAKPFFVNTIIILIVVTIFIFTAFFYNSVLLQRQEVRNQNNNTVSILRYDLENNLKKIAFNMFDYWGNDTNHIQLSYDKLNYLDTYLCSSEILKQYTNFMITHETIGCMAICSVQNKIVKIAYNNVNYTYQVQNDINSYIKGMINNVDDFLYRRWYVKNIDGKNFLVLVIGNNNAFNVCFVDLESANIIDSVLKNNNEQLLLYSSKIGDPLTNIEEVKKINVKLHKGESERYTSNGYYIVQQYSDYLNLNMVYITRDNGLLQYKKQFIITYIIAFTIIVFLIEIIYLIFKKYIIVPLRDLTEIMKKISIGDLDSKMKEDYRISELQNISETFNLMISNIVNLKIDKYELKLQKQKAEMQYLQLQMKPHFFLNCLKTLYGMAEQKKISNLQDMILAISNYIRYMFKSNLSKVPLKTEIEFVKNYIKLQKISSIQNVSYSINVEKEIEDCLVPPLCIQTFLENSFKYGIKPNCELQLSINAIKLCVEDKNYIDILVENNGSSFPDDVLQEINMNKSSSYNYEKSNTGLLNLKQRILNLYGEEASLICMNNETGVLNEIILPIN